MGTRPSISRFCVRCEKETMHSVIQRPKSRNNGKGFDYLCRICAKEYQRDRNERHMKEWVAYKGGKCEICRMEDETCVYDFHHIDPTTKKFRIQERWSSPFKSVKSELDKCQLLCSNCHRKVTKKIETNRGRPRTKKTFDKHCKKCNNVTEHLRYHRKRLNKNGTRKKGFDNHCIVCRKIRSQKRYLENSIKCFEYKGSKCYSCDLVDDICVYDFHHRDPYDKSFLIGRNYNRSFQKLREELNKCDMLCSNCHRKTYTYKYKNN